MLRYVVLVAGLAFYVYSITVLLKEISNFFVTQSNKTLEDPSLGL